MTSATVGTTSKSHDYLGCTTCNCDTPNPAAAALLKVNDTVKVISYVDEESDYPRTDLVGKTGTVNAVYPGLETFSVNVDGEDIVFYDYEIEKI